MNKERFTYLLERFQRENLQTEEREEFLRALESEDPQAIQAIVDQLEAGAFAIAEDDPQQAEESFKAIVGVDKTNKDHAVQATKPIHRVHFIRRFRWVAAAIILLIASAGIWFVLNDNNKQELLSEAQRFKNDVAPGKQGAILKLASGKIIRIDSMPAGLIAAENGVRIIKDGNGQIRYEGDGTTATLAYNEVITQTGEEVKLALPDQSVVVLNAGSSIRYPLRFAGNERLVSMTGEAYFDVVHNDKWPFRVQVGEKIIEDIGTIFNVNAYTDEPLFKTTLVEGSVKIGSTLVKAGEQARGALAGNNALQVVTVDTDVETAWVNGFFSFDNADLKTVLRQLSRWYKVEVVFEAGAPNTKFWGELRRDNSLVNTLTILEKSNVHFAIDGNKLTVLAK